MKHYTKPLRLSSALTTMFQGSVIVFLGLALRVAIVFATEVLAARLLLPRQYGLITWAVFALNLLSMITGMGLNTAVRRYLPMYALSNALAEIRGLVILAAGSSAMAGAGIVCAVYLLPERNISEIIGSVEAGTLVKILVLALPAWNLMKTMLAVFSGYKRPVSKVAIEDVLVPIGCLTVIVLAWSLQWGVVEIAWGYSMIYGIGAASAIFLVRAKTPFSETKNVAPRFEVKKIFSFAWPLIFTEPLGKLTGLVDILIIGWLANAYLVGIYRIASDMAAIMSLFLMCLSFLYLPIAAEYVAKNQLGEWRDLNARVARWGMTCCFPFFAVLFFFPKEVIYLIYGPAYLEAENVLRILALAYYGHVMVGFTGLNLAIAGHTKAQLLAHLVSFVSNILGNIILIPLYGAPGAAFSSLLSIFISNAFCLALIHRKFGLTPFTSFYVRNLAVFMVCAIFLSFLIREILEPNNLFSLVVYAGLCFSVLAFLYSRGLVTDEVDDNLLSKAIRQLAYNGS